MVKKKISEALKTQVWLHWVGEYFKSKCLVDWCQNIINARDFDVGHNIPESKGGCTTIKNLRPICRKCNLSMGNRYTIDQWTKNHKYTNSYMLQIVIWLCIILVISFWFYYYQGFKLFTPYQRSYTRFFRFF